VEPLLALDREVRHRPVEEAREPPVRAADQHHHRRHEQAADQRGIDRERDAHADAELLHGRVACQPVGRPPCVGALRHRAVVLLAEVDVERRQRERTQHDDRNDRRGQRMARDEAAPAQPPQRSHPCGRSSALRCGSGIGSLSIRSPTIPRIAVAQERAIDSRLSIPSRRCSRCLVTMNSA
jgi:hypothetical protein